MAQIPGIAAKHFIVSDTCCENRGEDGAIDFSLDGIRDEFHKLREVWKGKNAKMHIVLTVEREE